MMAMPVVSSVAIELWDEVGPLAASDGDANGWHGLLLCEALIGALQGLNDLVRDGQAPGWSRIVDLNRALDIDLPYLSQFVGVRPQAGDAAEVLRNRILAREGMARGRPSMMITRIQSLLTGQKRVVFAERDTSAYHATIRTYTSETPDPAAVTALIATLKPAGVQIGYVVATGATFAQIDAAVSDFNAAQAKWPTFNDMTNWLP